MTFSEKVSGFGSTGYPTGSLILTGAKYVLQSFYSAGAAELSGKVYYLSVNPTEPQAGRHRLLHALPLSTSQRIKTHVRAEGA